MGETAILIAAHKPFDPPALEGYLPVQVGAALAAQDLGFQRDDEGENISEKTPSTANSPAITGPGRTCRARKRWALCTTGGTSCTTCTPPT